MFVVVVVLVVVVVAAVVFVMCVIHDMTMHDDTIILHDDRMTVYMIE